MKRSHILSRFRTEFRRKGATYQQEVSSLRWIRKFMDELSIDHSSQIRSWQTEYFMSELKKKEYTYDELLQAKSALRFLMDKILVRTHTDEPVYNDEAPGFFRFTA